MQEQTVDVTLIPMNQQAPRSAGPMGRLARIQNGVVTKFLENNLRVSKRPGYTSLSTAAYYDGASTTSPTDPKVLTTWGDQLFMVGGVRAYARSEGNTAWEQIGNNWGKAAVAPLVVTRRAVFSGATVAYAPDVAVIGDVLCFVWADPTNGASAMLIDSRGVKIKAPFPLTGTTDAKVASDGTRFWIFSRTTGSTTIQIQLFDTAGASVATTSAAGAANQFWDVGYQPVTGQVVLVAPATTTTMVNYYSYSGSISVSAYTPTTDIASGVALIPNAHGGTNIYVAGVKAGGDVKAYEISSAGAVTTTYATYSTGSVGVSNVTGYVQNSSFDLVLCISVLADNTAGDTAALNNQMRTVTATHAGVTTLQQTLRSIVPVSRAFADASGYYRVWCGYQSTAGSIGSPASDISPLTCQPTFFAVDISDLTVAVPSVVGELEIGSAYTLNDTSRNGAHYRPWHVSSIAADTSAIYHMPLAQLGAQTIGVSGTAGFTAATSINDYQMGLAGFSVATVDDLLVPGFQGSSFDGNRLTESGIHLAPEIVSISQAAGGALTDLETYKYVVVWRSQNRDGTIVRSAPSAVYSITLAGSQQTTLTIAANRTTTRTGMVGEVYRTYDASGGHATGSILRKAGEVANSVSSDTLTFNDQLSDVNIQQGENIYSQVLASGAALARYGAPAFSRGCAGDGRVFVIGYDRAIWVSMEKQEGEFIAFNPELRILLPTPAAPVDVLAMDTRIIVFCDDGTQWGIPIGNLPNDTLTQGALPTPEQIPATAGAVQVTCLAPFGGIYTTLSGAWVLDRSLSSQFIGAPVVDDLHGISIKSVSMDETQRIYFVYGNTRQYVFDFVSRCWYVWTTSVATTLGTVWRGRFTCVDTNAVVYKIDDAATTTFTDDGAAILSIYEVNSIDFAGVNGYESCWQCQFYGDYKGPHALSVAVNFDQSTTVAQSLAQLVPTDPGIYRYEFLPTRVDCQAIGLVFSDSFPYGNGDSFTLESIGFLVGVEQGLGRLPPATQRIAP